MKIFEFEWKSGESDWVYAPDKDEAIEFYLKFTGCGQLNNCEVKEIPKNEWGEHYLLDLNETEPDDEEVEYNEYDYHYGLKIVETFADYAERETTTDMIATTEF